ncbi:MAG: hypothetical protein ABI811_00350 [Acidobacteriota bacterium]
MDYDIFVKVPRLDASDISRLQKIYKTEDFDFRLKPGAAAVDRGVVWCCTPSQTDLPGERLTWGR